MSIRINSETGSVLIPFDEDNEIASESSPAVFEITDGELRLVAETVDDDFDGSNLDGERWTKSEQGGISVVQNWGYVQMSGTAGTGGGRGRIVSTYQFTGIDFVIEVDFQSLSLPSFPEGGWAGIILYDGSSFETSQNTIELIRISDGFGDGYYLIRIYQDGIQTGWSRVETTDTSGTLRLVKLGGFIKAYYDDAGDFVQIGRDYFFAVDINMRLALSAEALGGYAISCQFDNFTATGTTDFPAKYSTSEGYVITREITLSTLLRWKEVLFRIKRNTGGTLKIKTEYATLTGSIAWAQFGDELTITEDRQTIDLLDVPVNKDGTDLLRFTITGSSTDGNGRCSDLESIELETVINAPEKYVIGRDRTRRILASTKDGIDRLKTGVAILTETP